MPDYSELRLRIDRGVSHGSYRVVASGPAGEALGRFRLPLSDIELENFVLKIGRTRRGRRRIESPEMELAKDFGTKLFGALFEGDVRELYRSSVADSRSSGRGLRVTLSLTGAPELLQIPWEYLYDHPSFLSISTWTPIVRYLDLPKPRRPLQVDLPIRVLALVSAPSDAEPIDAEQERTKLEAAVAPLIGRDAIAIDWLQEASLLALQRQLRRADYHVFHYIGHGGFDHDADDGVLMFEDELGRGRRVSGVQLGTILADEVSLRLAVLNSCEGGRSSLQDPFSGVATSLIEREIPAVIGMQFEITDRAAIVFAGEFYSALADGLAVDSAVAEARKAIYADENDIEWGTPVLFMRVADGRLFDVMPHEPIRQTAAEDVEVIAGLSAPTHDNAAVPTKLEVDQAADQERQAEAERLAEEERVAEAKREAEVEGQAETEREAEGQRQAEAERLAAEEDTAADVVGAAPDAKQGEAREAQPERSQPPDAETPGHKGSPSVVAANVPSALLGKQPSPTPTTPAPPQLPPGLGRAAARAAFGGVLAATIGDALYLISDHWWDLEATIKRYPEYAVTMAIAMAVVVVLAEGLLPMFRVPTGTLYQIVGGNRLGAAGIQGAVIGAIVAPVVINVVFSDLEHKYFENVLLFAAIGAGSFLLAEALIDRLLPKTPSAPAREARA